MCTVLCLWSSTEFGLLVRRMNPSTLHSHHAETTNLRAVKTAQVVRSGQVTLLTDQCKSECHSMSVYEAVFISIDSLAVKIDTNERRK